MTTEINNKLLNGKEYILCAAVWYEDIEVKLKITQKDICIPLTLIRG